MVQKNGINELLQTAKLVDFPITNANAGAVKYADVCGCGHTCIAQIGFDQKNGPTPCGQDAIVIALLDGQAKPLCVKHK